MYCQKCRRSVDPLVNEYTACEGYYVKVSLCPRCRSPLHLDLRRFKLPQRPTRSTRGLYVAFEGIDGVGKTLQTRLVSGELRRRGFSVEVVKEPYHDLIRDFLFRNLLDPITEAMVFAVDRLILQRKVVLPSLEEGKIVISDRSVVSSLVFQTVRGAPLGLVEMMNRGVLTPDVVIILDTDVETALSRIDSREKTRFEYVDLQRKVREAYLEIARERSYYVVDASPPPEYVFNEILSIIERHLEKWGNK